NNVTFFGVPEEAGARSFNSLVMSQRSSSRIYGNRFVDNTVPSVITIDMWEVYRLTKIDGRNVIFSNVIADNTLSGPVVHLMQGNRFQFFNNTVANNTLSTNAWMSIIGLGGRDEAGGNVFPDISDHLWDISNNLFFANRRAADNNGGVLNLISEQSGLNLNFSCNSVISGTNNGARFNWFIGSLAGYGGDCATVTGTPSVPANNNVFTNIDTVIADNVLTSTEIDTFYSTNFFTSVNDADHPYRLRPDATTNGVTFAFDPNPALTMDGLIVTGSSTTTTLTNKNPSTDVRALDALGNPRFVDQTDLSFDVIDYGAYELTEPEPVEFFNNTGGAYSAYNAGDFTFTMNEDGVAFIDMTRMVRKGFRPYTVEVVGNVTVYDTDPLNSCNGQPYLFDPVSGLLAYCPPDNFHNVGVTAPISFEYRVTGLFGTGTIPSPTTYATVTLVVAPVDDGIVTTATQKTATDFTTTINIPLRPRFNLDAGANFLSLLDASGVDNLDYPFTFSNFVETSDPNNLLGTPDSITDGVFTYTAPPGAVQGEFSFTYTATDQDGDFATRTVTVRVVDRILVSGLHDNTALGIVYSGTWTPVFNDVAYQKSLHSTTQNGAQARFNFTGDNFAISYVGNGVNNGGITIQLDSDGDNFGTATYTNIYSIPGLTCTAVTPAAGNPIQTAVNGRNIIRCTGIESLAGAAGEVHTVRITSTNTNAFRLDWVQVDAQPLTIGMYEDTDLRPYLTNMSYYANAFSVNGSWEAFEFANSRVIFSVDPTVKRIKIYRTLDLGRDDLIIDLSGPSCTSNSVTVFGLGPEQMWGTPQTVQLNNCTEVSIRRAFTAGKTQAQGVDKIELIGPANTLGAGTYHTADLNEFATGRNGQVLNGAAQDGRFFRLMDGVFTFNIASNVESMVLYRQDYNWRDSINIKTLSCADSSHAQNLIFTNTNPVATFSQPIVVNNIRSCTRIEISRMIGTGLAAWAVLLERMELRSQNSGELGLGYYDNLDLIPYFNSNALLLAEPNSAFGSWHRFEVGASMNFTVASGVERMIIHRPQDLYREDLNVALSNGCTPTNVVVGGLGPLALWNQSFAVDLQGCKTVTITRINDPARPWRNGIDAITLLGAPQPLNVGEYHTVNLREFINGRNGTLSSSFAQQGISLRLMDGVFTFPVHPDVETMILYSQNYNLRDTIEVKTLDCSIGADVGTFTFPSTSPSELWGEPLLVPIKSCATVEIRRLIGTGGAAWASVVEELHLLGANPVTFDIGEYDNLEMIPYFTNSTVLANSAASNDTWHRLNAGGSLTFNVTSNAERLMVFRPIDLYRQDLIITLSNTCDSPVAPILVSSLGPTSLWNQSYTIDLNGCNTVSITPASTAGKTDPIGIDGIRLLGAPTPLSVGTYHTTNLTEFMTGRNGSLVSSEAQDGISHRLMDGLFRFEIDQNVDTLVLYRNNLSWRDDIRIDTDQCTTPADAKTNLIFDNLNTTGIFGDPIVVQNIGSCTRVTIQRVIGTGDLAWASVTERLVLLADPQPPLTSGNIYEEFDTGIAYSPSLAWVESSFSDIPSRRIMRTNTLNASLTFTVTGNGFIVYHRASSFGTNNIEVCVQTGANPATCTNYSIQTSTPILQYPVGIYGLGSGTHTVTITNKQSGGNLTIDAIRIP
ncbi:MAG: hypothetical protein KJ043_02300, partial [Anaerolineae bacterium]|nr:hypothetical protein [Anaerolineae bacterium]